MLRSFLIIMLIYGLTSPALLPLRLGGPIFLLIRDVSIRRANPALYEYLYFLPINISESLVGSEITIEWNPLIYVKEIHMPERFWRVKSFIAITKLEWARMERCLRARVSAWLGDEPLKVLAWELTDKIPFIGWITLNKTTLELAFNNPWNCSATGWCHPPDWDVDRFPVLNASWICTHEVLPFKEIFLFCETYFPYPGLKNYRCFRLNPQSDRLVYRFTEPGRYILVHKYVVTESIKKFDKFKDLRVMLTIIHVVLRSPDGEVLLDKRFMVYATPTIYYEREKGNMAIRDNDKEWNELIRKSS
ncbi:MAG: hypothetical protein J7L11_11065 [Thermoprotei archaeon]|nr:hypothetical protein [Thermoprotei archaeon]